VRLSIPKRAGLLAFLAMAMVLLGFLGARYIASSRVSADRSCQTIQCVALGSEGANPDTLAIPVGSSVQFNSADDKTHSLSLGKGGDAHGHSGPFTSGDFGSEEAWKVQFKEPGTFHFHDHYNPKLNILIVVYEPNGDHTIRR
jgi:plastocyanin